MIGLPPSHLPSRIVQADIANADAPTFVGALPIGSMCGVAAAGRYMLRVKAVITANITMNAATASIGARHMPVRRWRRTASGTIAASPSSANTMPPARVERNAAPAISPA